MNKNSASTTKVSVILPTYNRADYLKKAINSVLSQTYMDWELIIWNDGSTDHTKDVVESFEDARIKYYYEENQGKSYALNKALQVANGEYVAFLDDDDQWIEEKTEIQVGILERHPEIDVLFANFNNINVATGVEGVGFVQNARGLEQLHVEELENNVYLIKNKFPESISTSNFLLPSSMIVRKQVFKSVGKFNESLRNSLDIEYFWRIYLYGYNFAYTNEILLNRIKPLDSLSSTSVANYENVIKSMDSIFAEFLKNNRQDLIHLLNNAYKRAWLGITREYAKAGQRKKAWHALKQSWKYGLDLKDFFSLSKSVVGGKLRNLMKN